MPKVSVIMPVYNTNPEYLKECIDGILCQTFTDFEFLFIDNGSDAYIKDFIDKYSDERVKYYRIDKNNGPAAARNYAIEQAEGEYIAFADSDDISLPERFEKQVKYLDEHKEVGCLGTEFEVFGDAIPLRDDLSNLLRRHLSKECFLIFWGCFFCQSSVMVRNSVIKKYGIRYKDELCLAEDYAFLVELIGKTKIDMLTERLVKYRSHYDSVTHRFENEQREKIIAVQQYAINTHCAQKGENQDILKKYLACDQLTEEEQGELFKMIINWTKTAFCCQGCANKVLSYCPLRKKVRKMYYHTRSVKGQWNLMKSPINKIFALPFWWRLVVFLTRGIL